ncbi:MAG: hypothetical protein ACO1RX_13780 [Candidatus Sericytochromatia bacterium]
MLRNPMGGDAAIRQSGQSAAPVQRFLGNPLTLQQLYLRLDPEKALQQGDRLQLDVLAFDGQGRQIDPARLSLRWGSTQTQLVQVDAQGRLTAVGAGGLSVISVTDAASGRVATQPLWVVPQQFTGDPHQLVSLQLVMPHQTLPGNASQAQYQVIARDRSGQLIDPARLQLNWNLPATQWFRVDANGRVTALSNQGASPLVVRDLHSGLSAWGSVQVASGAPESPPPGVRPVSMPSAIPGMPTAPVSSSPPVTPVQNSQPPATPEIETGQVRQLVLSPAFAFLDRGELLPLGVQLLSDDHQPLALRNASLVWSSSKPDLFHVDQQGVVTALESSGSATITVRDTRSGRSASMQVSATSAENPGGGGGSGGGSSVPLPAPPQVSTLPLSPSSFTVLLTPPAGPQPRSYQISVNGYSFTVDGATLRVDVPAQAGLQPESLYAVTVVALSTQGRFSAAVNSSGTTLPSSGAPLHLLNGSPTVNGLFFGDAGADLVFSPGSGRSLSVAAAQTQSLTTTLSPSGGSLRWAVAPSNGVEMSGEGTAASPWVLSGTPEQVNAALGQLVFVPDPGFSGLALLSLATVDDQQRSDLDAVQISINHAQASPPLHQLNGSPDLAGQPQDTAVNTPLQFLALYQRALSVSDVNGQVLTTTLIPHNGSVSVSALPMGVSSLGNGTASSPLLLTGNPYALSTALQSLRFLPDPDYLGTASLQIRSTDGALRDQDTLVIHVLTPGQTYAQQGTFPTEARPVAAGGRLSWSQSGSNALGLRGFGPELPVTVTLSVGAGALSLSNGGALSVSGSGSSSLVLQGSETAINQALADGLHWDAPATAQSAQLQMQSSNGSFGDLDTLPLRVEVAPANRYAGSATFPSSAQDILGGASLVFSSANSNALSITETGGSITVSLAAEHATLSLVNAGTEGMVSGAGTTASPLQLVGSASVINAVLAQGLRLNPEPAFTGALSLNLTSSNLAGSDSDSVPLNILAAPENRFNAISPFPATALPVLRNGSLTLSGSRQLSVNHYGSAPVTVTLQASNGVLQVNTPGTLSLTGQNSASLSLSGSQTALNAALAEGVVFTPALNFTGTAGLTMQSRSGDTGDFDPGDSLDFFVSEAPLNYFNAQSDFPSAQTPLSIGLYSPTLLRSPDGRALSVQDDSPSLTVQLAPSSGVLTFADTLPNGISQSGSGTSASPWVLSGAPSALNQALDLLRFTPAQAGAAQVTLTSQDGSASDSDTLHLQAFANSIVLNTPGSVTEAVGHVFSLKATPVLDSSQINGAVVEFFQGETRIATGVRQGDGSYTATWDTQGVTPGVQSLSARLRSGGSALASSASTSVTLVANALTFATPASDSLFNLGRDTVPIVVTPSLGDSQVGQVTLTVMATQEGATTPLSLGTDTSLDGNQQFGVDWVTTALASNNLADGKYTLTATLTQGATVLASATRQVELTFFGYTLYGVDNANGKMYKVNTNPARSPGQPSEIGSIANARNAVDKHPVTGEVIYISTTAQLVAWDPRTTVGTAMSGPGVANLGSPPRLGISQQSPNLVYYTPSGGSSSLVELDISDRSNVTRRDLIFRNAADTANLSLNNGGDLAFEPSTGRLFISSNELLYTGTVSATSTHVPLTQLANLNGQFVDGTGRSYSNPAGIGFDTVANRVLVVPRFGPNSANCRLFSVDYSNLANITVTALAYDSYGFLFGDITSAHSNTLAP